ncbi:DUF1015 domain-containing protein, partial [Tyzzerella sp. OttesenSCG-928-J15]|nr:DUF1015 domain-containing protein [Tyzzerella sp. OttesenSCG-928-J15]
MDYNRIVKDLNGNSKDEFIAKVKERFDVEAYNGGQYHPEKAHTFGMYMDKQWYKITAKPEFIDENDP